MSQLWTLIPLYEKETNFLTQNQTVLRDKDAPIKHKTCFLKPCVVLFLSKVPPQQVTNQTRSRKRRGSKCLYSHFHDDSSLHLLRRHKKIRKCQQNILNTRDQNESMLNIYKSSNDALTISKWCWRKCIYIIGNFIHQKLQMVCIKLQFNTTQLSL